MRHGTISPIAAMFVHAGQVNAATIERHESVED